MTVLGLKTVEGFQGVRAWEGPRICSQIPGRVPRHFVPVPHHLRPVAQDLGLGFRV